MRKIPDMLVAVGLLALAGLAAWGLRTAWAWGRAGGAVVRFYADDRLGRMAAYRVLPALDFFAPGSPARGVPADRFSLRASAWLDVPERALYTFATLSDDGIRLIIDGRPVIDNWRDQGWTDSARHTNLYLEAGAHPVTVEFYDGTEEARFRVEWAGGPIPPRTVLGAPWLRKRGWPAR